MITNAPVAIFTYKKQTPLMRTVEALTKNELAINTELYIFSDGAKNQDDMKQVAAVRTYIHTIRGFKNITIFEADKNHGLADSIISGVTKVFENHESIIVLEDDLISSRNFLNFMNQGLQNYKNNQNVFSISGYTFPIKTPNGYAFDNYFTKRASSWGWATWKNRWNVIDWSVTDYSEFSKNRSEQRKFNAMGSDMSEMLAKQMKGQLSSWAIRWCYHQFKNNLFTVYPTLSKIANIGFGEEATHTKTSNNRFETNLDESMNTNFKFKLETELEDVFTKQFVANFSIRTRIYYKLKNWVSI